MKYYVRILVLNCVFFFFFFICYVNIFKWNMMHYVRILVLNCFCFIMFTNEIK